MMMPGIFRDSPVLELYVENDFYILTPNDTEADIRGQVRLYLPRPRNIKSIHIDLVSKYSLLSPKHGWESGTQLTKSTNIYGATADENHLPAGDHVFDFSLVLPSYWPPYDRTKWGKVDTSLIAIVQSPGWLEPDLKTEQNLGFVFNHAPVGESHSIDVVSEGYDEILGPYCMSIVSPHFATGGMFFVSLYLASPAKEIDIYSIRVNILQTGLLFSRLHSEEPERTAPQVLKIAEIDHRTDDSTRKESHLTPFQSIKYTGRGIMHGLPRDTPPRLTGVTRGKPFFVSFLGRLPDDDYLRSTTNTLSKTPIEVSHQLQLSMRYDNLESGEDNHNLNKGERKLREVEITRKVVVESCACLLETILLPSYTAIDPHPSPQQQYQQPNQLPFLRSTSTSSVNSNSSSSDKRHRHSHPRPKQRHFPCLCEVSLEKQGIDLFKASLKNRCPPFLTSTESSNDNLRDLLPKPR